MSQCVMCSSGQPHVCVYPEVSAYETYVNVDPLIIEKLDKILNKLEQLELRLGLFG